VTIWTAKGRLLGLFAASSLLAVQPTSGRGQKLLRDMRNTGRVEAKRIATLRFENAPVAPDIQTQVFRLPGGGWGAISPVFRGRVPTFSAAGSWTGTLGRPGPGPGEFKHPFFAMAVGKQLWVVDPGNNRITAFGPDGAVVGDRTLPGRVIWVQPIAGGLLLSGFFPSPSGVVNTVGRVTMNKADDEFGGQPGTSNNAWVELHLATETSSGQVWTVSMAGGRIGILRAHKLGPLASAQLPEELSQPEAHAPEDLSGERPAPRVDGVMTDSDGIVWIVMGVADAHWRRGLNPATDTNKIFDTLVLAVSPQDRAIIGALRMDRSCRPVFSVVGGLMSCVNESAATVDILRLRHQASAVPRGPPQNELK
jgi:hypothetical protein